MSIPLAALQQTDITPTGVEVINVRGELFLVRSVQILSTPGYRIDGATRATYCTTFADAVAWMG